MYRQSRRRRPASTRPAGISLTSSTRDIDHVVANAGSRIPLAAVTHPNVSTPTVNRVAERVIDGLSTDGDDPYLQLLAGRLIEPGNPVGARLTAENRSRLVVTVASLT